MFYPISNRCDAFGSVALLKESINADNVARFADDCYSVDRLIDCLNMLYKHYAHANCMRLVSRKHVRFSSSAKYDERTSDN